MSAQPKISVVMPSYGKADFIAESIESVLGQTFGDFELIIVDDKSVDGSLGIASRFALEDNRVRVIMKPTRTGVSSSINIGIETARGEAVAFLAADDVYASEKLERQWNRLESESETSVVYCDRWKMDEGGKVIPRKRPGAFSKSGRIFGELLARGYGEIASTLVPRICFRTVGAFDESLHWSEDFDLLLRLARTFPFAFVPEKLYGYRVYPGNTSQRIDRRTRLSIQARIIEKNLREGKDQLTRDQRSRAEEEMLRFYWVTGQWGRLFARGLRSIDGTRSVARYSARSLLGKSHMAAEAQDQ